MKLNLACGNSAKEGFVSVDICPLSHVDQVVDLLEFPWPWHSETVDEVFCSHFFEHVPGKLRPRWMSELWRVLELGGIATIQTPLGYERQVQDFSHEWPPVVPETFRYFNQEWLKHCNLVHYTLLHGIHCNFQVISESLDLAVEFADKPPIDREFAIKHYMRSTSDLYVVLKKMELEECWP